MLLGFACAGTLDNKKAANNAGLLMRANEDFFISQKNVKLHSLNTMNTSIFWKTTSCFLGLLCARQTHPFPQ
jgi:hypothetical protein